MTNETVDTFGDKLQTLNELSGESYLYIRDYFYLRNILRETPINLTHDYSYLVFPVNKSLECYLEAIFRTIFHYKVSTKKDETIGHYLGLPKEKIYTEIDIVLKKTIRWGNKHTQNRDEWFDRLNELSLSWKSERNPLTHPNIEILPNIVKAEQSASLIIRTIEKSLAVFKRDYFDYKNKQEQKTRLKKMISQQAIRPTSGRIIG